MTDKAERFANDVASKVVESLKASHKQLENFAHVVIKLKSDYKNLQKDIEILNKIVKGNGESDPILSRIKLLDTKLLGFEKEFIDLKNNLLEKINFLENLTLNKLSDIKSDITDQIKDLENNVTGLDKKIEEIDSDIEELKKFSTVNENLEKKKLDIWKIIATAIATLATAIATALTMANATH